MKAYDFMILVAWIFSYILFVYAGIFNRRWAWIPATFIALGMIYALVHMAW